MMPALPSGHGELVKLSAPVSDELVDEVFLRQEQRGCISWT
jgi:hypothetical protein